MTTQTQPQEAQLPADVQAILDKNPQAKPLGFAGRLPSVRLNASEGLFIEGVYKTFSSRDVKGKPTKFHTLAFGRSSAKVEGWDKEAKVPTTITPQAGELVEIMGGKIIDECVSGMEGRKLLIVYLGKVQGKANAYHNFKVYDLGA